MGDDPHEAMTPRVIMHRTESPWSPAEEHECEGGMIRRDQIPRVATVWIIEGVSLPFLPAVSLHRRLDQRLVQIPSMGLNFPTHDLDQVPQAQRPFLGSREDGRRSSILSCFLDLGGGGVGVQVQVFNFLQERFRDGRSFLEFPVMLEIIHDGWMR